MSLRLFIYGLVLSIDTGEQIVDLALQSGELPFHRRRGLFAPDQVH